MIGFHFKKYDPNEDGKAKFDQLLDIFMQLLNSLASSFYDNNHSFFVLET